MWLLKNKIVANRCVASDLMYLLLQGVSYPYFNSVNRLMGSTKL